MLPKRLSTRLLLAFAFVVVLTLLVSAVGTLFLLRDQQRDAAEERVGRLAEPIAVTIALLERADVDEGQVRSTLDGFANSFGVRILTVDAEGNVLYDTDSSLSGGVVDAFVTDDRAPVERGGARFRMARFDTGEENLMLFSSARNSIELTTSQLSDLQAFLYQNAAQGESVSIQLQRALNSLSEGDATTLSFPLPDSRALVAVPEAEITAAWRDIIPQVSIAGGIALIAAAIAAVLIARSVTGRLARVTHAAQEMAQGHYEQQLEPAGEDEIGKLAEAFNDMSHQVSRSDQAMRDLLANVSHELKTPLTSIQGFSQAMQEGAISSDDEYRQAGRIINEETDRMRRMIDELIELSRLESGQTPLQLERVNLQELLRGCAERIERLPAGAEPGIELDLPDLPTIEGDGRRLEQVFTNLLNNAVVHGNGSSAITVRAEAENGLVRVDIHNTGSFIPQAELPRVFERFFQTDRNRSSHGSGLGLAIVKEVVQAHGGNVRAESSQEDGTDFIVELPLQPTINGG